MHQKKTALRVIGFLLSLILTISLYFIVVSPDFFHLNSGMAVKVIFMLAILQALVQSVFFLDIWSKGDLFWNVGFYVSTISVIVVIVFFTIWIMANLDYNMMPRMA